MTAGARTSERVAGTCLSCFTRPADPNDILQRCPSCQRDDIEGAAMNAAARDVHPAGRWNRQGEYLVNGRVIPKPGAP